MRSPGSQRIRHPKDFLAEKQGKRPRHGLVLLIVMLVVVLVSLAGFGFVAMMFTEHKGVRVRGEQIQIEQAQNSAELLLGELLEEQVRNLRKNSGALESGSPDGSSDSGKVTETIFESSLSGNGTGATEVNGVFDLPDLLQGRSLISSIESPGEIRFTVVTPRRSSDTTLGKGVPLGEPVVRYGVEDESSRLNLAVLMEWERKLPGSGAGALLKLPGMTIEVADSILDWLDADDDARDQGGESEYYAGLTPPYAPRNGTPESIEELLLVKGISRRMLFGDDENQNGILEEQEMKSQLDEGGGISTEGGLGWNPYLTLYSRESNRNSKGELRVDVNHPDLTLLHARLMVIDKNWADFIVLGRQYGFQTAETSVETKSVPAHLPQVDLKKRPAFRIESLLDLFDALVLIPPSDGKGVPALLKSPFQSEPEELKRVLPRMLTELTIAPDKILEGRISLTSASALVLSMVPRLPTEAIERIISGQGQQAGSLSRAYRTPAWLFTEGVVDREVFRAIEPYLTCQGEVFRAQIVGYSSRSRLSGRVEVVIDVSQGSPRRLYWRDLQLWGRGYAWEILDPSLAQSSREGPRMMDRARSGGVLPSQ